MKTADGLAQIAASATAASASALHQAETNPKPAGNETDPSADFIIGALLYSLFGSRHGESIAQMLPGDADEQ